MVGSSQTRNSGLRRQRARDRDALALAAGELVRVLLAVGRRRARRRCSSSPTRCADRRRRSSIRPCARIGSAMMSATRQRGLRLAYGSWKIICKRRRIARSCARRLDRGEVGAVEDDRAARRPVEPDRSGAPPSTCRSRIRRPARASRRAVDREGDAVDGLAGSAAAGPRCTRFSHGARHVEVAREVARPRRSGFGRRAPSGMRHATHRPARPQARGAAHRS